MFDIYSTRIQYFVKVAQEKSFYEAAFKLSVTQPALSSAIKKLESECGFMLFERSKRGIKLTSAGATLYKELIRYRVHLRNSFYPSLGVQEKPLLRVACVGHLASRYFLDVLEQSRELLPIVHLFTSNSLDCYESVLKGTAQFAFVAWSSKPKRLKSIRIAPEPVAFVGLKKAFPHIHKVDSLEELQKLPWVDLPKPQREWTTLLDTSRVGYVAKDVRILRDIVLRGLGVGYLQLNLFTKDELALLNRAPVKPFYKDPGIYAVYKSELSKESKGHLDILVERFRALAQS